MTTGILVLFACHRILVNLKNVIGGVNSNTVRKSFINSMEFFLLCDNKVYSDQVDFHRDTCIWKFFRIDNYPV